MITLETLLDNYERQLREEAQMAPKEITIKRNAELHCWMIVGAEGAAADRQTPWLDTAPAVSVATWLRSTNDGAVKVKVQL